MRLIVESGEKVADFFSSDMQNIYYKFLYKKKLKEKLKNNNIQINKSYNKSIKKYWGNYTKIDSKWHHLYTSKNNISDVRYIPDNIYYSKIEPFYNRKQFAKALDDKSFYSERFKDIDTPEIIVRNISGNYFNSDFNLISVEEAINKCISVEEFVIKLSIDGSGGDSVKFIHKENIPNMEYLSNLFKNYEKDFIIERVINQHIQIKDINPSSVNTIRLLTFMFEGKVHLLSSVFRMGGSNSRVDNFSSGGISCGITKEGVLKNIAYDSNFKSYCKHPSGTSFSLMKIPSYAEAVEKVKQQHLKFGHFKIISWDIAIGEKGEVILLEFNITPQSIDFHQLNNGPLFGELTESVLSDIYK